MSDLAEDPPAAEHPETTPPEPESIRQEYRREEAMIRGLGKSQIGIGTLAAALAVLAISNAVETYRAVTAAAGAITADWVFDPLRTAWMATLAITGLAMMVAGFALWRVRRWSVSTEVVVVLLTFAACALAWARAARDGLGGAGTDALLMPMFLVHPLAVVYVGTTPRVQAVLSAEYAAAMEQTRHIKVKGKVPWSIRLTLAAILLLYLVAVVAGYKLLAAP